MLHLSYAASILFDFIPNSCGFILRNFKITKGSNSNVNYRNLKSGSFQIQNFSPFKTSATFLCKAQWQYHLWNKNLK